MTPRTLFLRMQSGVLASCEELDGYLLGTCISLASKYCHGVFGGRNHCTFVRIYTAIYTAKLYVPSPASTPKFGATPIFRTPIRARKKRESPRPALGCLGTNSAILRLGIFH